MPKAKKGKKHSAARELLVQMQINRSNAGADDSGANVDASAVISVLVTLDGEPIADLGASTGNQISVTALPTGWTLRDGFNVRPYGSDVSITEFSNQGEGIYAIRIVPYVDNPASKWLSGEYIYGIQIKTSRTIAGKNVSLQGSALGKLTIL